MLLRSLFWALSGCLFLPSATFALPESLGDFDEDGAVTVLDVVRLINHARGADPLSPELEAFGDLNGDGFVNLEDAAFVKDTALERSALRSLPLSVTRAASPGPGEGRVAVTRETIVQLSVPLSPESAAAISSDDFFASFGGEKLAGRLRVSANRKTITLFYDEPLPAGGRVRVTLNGDGLQDFAGRALDADGDGAAGGSLVFDFDTLSLSFFPGTAVCGRVFASELAPAQSGSMSVNQPLEGVTITVDGLEETLFAVTDQNGNFRLDDAPVGRFFVHIDGRTASAPAPDGAFYPTVGKSWETEPGVETNIGEVFLPLVEGDALRPVSPTEDTVVTVSESVTSEFPEFERVSLTVPAGSLFADDGTPGTMVGLSPVPPDRLPGELPAGLDLSTVITVQTDGATNFDEPARVCFPNQPDPETGELLGPGEKTALWSFNHDSGEWEIVGPMTVSEDGLTVCSDPGAGLRAPGWHGTVVAVFVFDGQMFVQFDDGRVEPLATAAQECARNDCPCKGNCKSANAVFFQSGEEVFTRADLAIPGRAGLDFQMTRVYRSRLDYDGPLGHGWNFSYNEGLFIKENGDVARWNGRSHLGLWTRQPDGSFASPPGYFSVLRQLEDGSFVLTESDGFKRFYRSDGRLFCHQDRFGNRILFDYDERGNLSKAIDVYGREIDFFFEIQSDGVDRLVRIEDFIGRVVTYEYDSRGDLVSVTSPAIEGTSTGDDLPEGRKEVYTYSSGFDNEELNHNLLSVTAPEEVATGGPPVFSWTYGNDPADPLTFDKVVEERLGGTNASGVPAGGTMSVAYEELNQDQPEGQPDLPRCKAIVTEPNGNVVEHFVNEFKLNIATRQLTRGLREGEPAFHETRAFFDEDGQTIRIVKPNGNEVRFAYDGGGGRLSASNLVERREIADGLPDLVTTFSYEPLYNQIRTVTDPRGNDPSYVPPLGAQSAARYTTTYFYDYQESGDPVPLAEELGLDLSGIPRELGDLNGDARTDQTFGNFVRVEGPSVQLLPDAAEVQRLGGTTQPNILETQWNDRGQILAQIDGEGIVTAFEYYPENDPDGDGQTNVSRYVALSDRPIGYLSRQVADARSSPRRLNEVPPLALASEIGYDPVGNVVRETNPRGVSRLIEYNQLDEPVAIVQGHDIEKALASGELLVDDAPLGVRTEMRYDRNGRIIRLSVDNQDASAAGVGAFVDTDYVYDILNNPLSETTEIAEGASTTTLYRYDESGLLVRIVKPEGNEILNAYDERNLLLSTTIAPNSASPRVTTFDYDANGNQIRVTDSEDTDGNGQPESLTSVYDGHDRLIAHIDALGNRAESDYDPSGFVIEKRAFGRPPAEPDGALALLERQRYRNDERNRVFAADTQIFLPDIFSPLRAPVFEDADDDGWATIRYEFDRNSQRTRTVTDGGDDTLFEFDGAGRLILTIDAAGNAQSFVYDANGNPIESTASEIVEGGGLPERAVSSLMLYDQLDRMVRLTDSVGQTRRFAYDRRNNLVRQTDASGPLIDDPFGLFPGPINAPGNVTRYLYDALDRQTAQIVELRVGGAGDGALDTSNPANPDGLVAFAFEYDRNSRLVSRIDANGNATRVDYDAHDRMTRVLYPDQSPATYVYDGEGNIIRFEDPNGSVVVHQYDALNRLVQTAVTPSAGVTGSVSQSYEYDGLSRVTRKIDRSGPAGEAQEVLLAYDSLNRLVEERQNGQPVSYAFSGSGDLTGLVYPGGRQLALANDALGRPTRVEDAQGLLWETRYLGSRYREAKRTYGNGVALTYLDGAEEQFVGYDAVQRQIAKRYVDSDGTPLVDRRYEYNRMSHLSAERREEDGGLEDRYRYDSLYRVERTELDFDGPTPSQTRPVSAIDYRYDDAGNRVAQTRQTGSGPETSDFEINALNQYAEIDGQAFAYDANGNLLSDGVRQFAYDFRNRLVEVRDAATGNRIARYSYFTDNRRALKEIFDPATDQPFGVAAFHYAGLQPIEDRDPDSGESLATYVHHPGILGEALHLRREAAHPLGAADRFLHSNVRLDVVALTDDTGAVAERYLYDDFGNTDSAAAEGNPFRFQGYRLDEETGLYYALNRYYDPELGRFLSRDPVFDPVNLGNPYAFVGNAPAGRRDPKGLNASQTDPSITAQFLKILQEQFGSDAFAAGNNGLGGLQTLLENRGLRQQMAALSDDIVGLSRLQLNGVPTRSYQNFRATSTLSSQGEALLDSLRGQRAGLANQIADNLNPSIKGMSAADGFKGMGHLDLALNAISESSQSMNTTWTGASARVGAVAVDGALLGATPQGAILQMSSGIVDNLVELGETYEVFDIGGPPKAEEVFKNAGRSVGVLGDFVSDWVNPATDCRGRALPNRGWQSMRNLVNNMKNNQGSISRKFVEWGETAGDAWGDVYNYFSGESDRAAQLEAQRQRLLRNRGR